MGLLKSKIRFYQSLATMLEAGVSIVKALKQNQPAPFNQVTSDIAQKIEEHGGSLADYCCDYPQYFDSFEQQLFRVGENTGHLDQILKSLVPWYEKALQRRKKVIAKMIYPFFIYHTAAIILPILFSIFNETSFLITGLAVIAVSIIPYLLLLMIKFGMILFNSIAEGPLLSLRAYALYIPLIGTLQRKLNYFRFFSIYSLCLEVGLSAFDAVSAGASVCKNRWLKQQFYNTAEYMKTNNCAFFEAYDHFILAVDRESIIFPMMESGETSGHAPDTAKYIANHYEEEAEEQMELVASLVPKLIYFLLVFLLAGAIVYFWSQLFSKLSRLG